MLLPRLDDTHLVLRCHTSVDGAVGDEVVELVVAHLLQLGAVGHPVTLLEDPDLPGDGRGGHLVVTGDHHRLDAGGAALGDGGDHLRTSRIDHPHETDEGQVSLHCLGGLFGRE